MRVTGYEQMIDTITKALESRNDENLSLWQEVLEQTRQENAALAYTKESTITDTQVQAQLEKDAQMWDMYDLITGNTTGFDLLMRAQRQQMMQTLMQSYKAGLY